MSGSVDAVEKELTAKLRKKRLISVAIVAAILAALVLLYKPGVYAYTLFRIAQARQSGVYATVQEAAIATFSQDSRDAKVTSVSSPVCSPNYPDGRLEHVWFCRAYVKMDRIPRGFQRSEFLYGTFFIRLSDGWVYMSEGSLPELIGETMQRYHLEGVQ